MHQLWKETINTGVLATNACPNGNHLCFRHWAFALFKKGDYGNAVTKIKQAVLYEPNDPENWLVWGYIMRSIGNYESA